MNVDTVNDFWNLINDCGDLVSGGWKRRHGEAPVFRRAEPVKASTAPVTEKGGVMPDRISDSLEQIASEVAACRKCGLCGTRKNTVPGAGSASPQVMIIGEGPGGDEDECGLPFVGKAGQYLDKWLAAINLDRSRDCFIGNIIKCRPPGNRDPQPDEISACIPYLKRQLELLRPGYIVTLGRFASQMICGSGEGIGRLRGRIHSYNGIPVFPTYHPSAVLRNPELRADVWADLKRLRAMMDGQVQ